MHAHAQVTPTVTEMADGTFSVSYTLARPGGEVTVRVRVGGKEIAASPWTVPVSDVAYERAKVRIIAAKGTIG